MDPPLSSSATSRKGKGKAKNLGGRKYHQVGNHDDDDGEGEGDEREQGETKRSRPLSKQGLNDYEKALWKWVNVDDLDGFLQEVRESYPFECRLTSTDMVGVRFLQRQRVLLYLSRKAT